MQLNKWTGRAFGAALLVGVLGGCDFIESGATDPNAVGAATADQLFTAAQVATFHISESQTSRVAALWTQALAGVSNQFVSLDIYSFDEEEGDSDWGVIYPGGGLVDIRRAIAEAEAAGTPRRNLAGVLKIHEAFLVGTAADVWGDIPYSQAVDVENNPTPSLDQQLAVYAAIQTRLDQAIADLGTDQGDAAFGERDLNFGGNVAAWRTVARTLKARYYMHVAEVQGNAAYQAAYDQAVQGIQSVGGNWKGVHSSSSTEQNLWFQFNRDRPQHIVGGHYLVNLLNRGTPGVFTDDDPRLAIYFTQAVGAFAGTYRGSFAGIPGGDPETNASRLNTAAGSPGAENYPLPIVGCTENAGIAAEAAYRLGRIDDARTWYNRMINCQEARYGVELDGSAAGSTRRVPDVSALTGAALLEAIMTQKYIGLFLNLEIWNDYKRTCYPRVTPPTAQGSLVANELPTRLYYPQSERLTNPNIPSVNQQDQSPRNDNDPNPCPLPPAGS